MMVSMLGSNQQELLLQGLMNDIIRADLAVLHRKKIANLVSTEFPIIWVCCAVLRAN